jgi:hypothetical protein
VRLPLTLGLLRPHSHGVACTHLQCHPHAQTPRHSRPAHQTHTARSLIVSGCTGQSERSMRLAADKCSSTRGSKELMQLLNPCPRSALLICLVLTG